MGGPEQAHSLIIICSVMLFALDQVKGDERVLLSN